MPAKACEICETAGTTPHVTVAGYTIVRCRTCGLLYVDHRPGALDIAELYDANYYGENKTAADVYPGYRDDQTVIEHNFEELLEWTERTVKRGSLLEIGSAYGFFLLAAKRRGWSVSGVKVSEFSSRVAREEFGLSVFTGGIEDLPEGDPVEAVFMLDTIEHLEHPRAVLRRAADRLQPGGHLVFTTGDAGSLLARVTGRRWRMVAPPHHLYYFTVPTVSRLLEESGFRVVKVRHSGKTFSTRSLVRFATGGRITGFPAWPVRVNLGDVMTVLAIKDPSSQSRAGSAENQGSVPS